MRVVLGTEVLTCDLVSCPTFTLCSCMVFLMHELTKQIMLKFVQYGWVSVTH